MASGNTTSAAYPRPDGVDATTQGAPPQPFVHLSPTDAAYMLSSPTSSAGVTGTSSVPAAVLSAPASDQLSLNGLSPDSHVYNAPQPQTHVGNTSGGPCLPYSLGPDNRFHYDHSAMPIQNRTSTEALDAYHSQQFHGPGQSNNFGIARPHPQQVFVFHGLSAPDTTTNPGGYQQYQHPPVYTVSRDLFPTPPAPHIVAGLATAPIYLRSKLLAIPQLFLPKFSII